MSILESISSPADLRELSKEELDTLAEEIRTFILDKVSKSGGHLSPNLGVVELTLALHRVFDSPTDRFIWDVGPPGLCAQVGHGAHGGLRPSPSHWRAIGLPEP